MTSTILPFTNYPATTEQILSLFSLAERHQLMQDGKVAQIFDVEFTDLQRQLLTLLGVSAEHISAATVDRNSPQIGSSTCGM